MRTRFVARTRAERLAEARSRSRRRIRRTGTASSGVLLIVVVIVGGALAYWSAGGAGVGLGAATGLSAPTNVATSVLDRTVHVTWSGVIPPGTDSFGYYVERFTAADGYVGAGPAGGTCASFPGALLAASPTSCDDTNVPVGTYEYRVVAVFRSWTAASAPSAAVAVIALDHFIVSTSASTTAGVPLTVIVTAKDASGSTITNYTGTVHFSASDAAATLPPDYTFVAGDSGTHSFAGALVLTTAGVQTVGVDDVVLTNRTGSTNVTVNGAALDHFVVTAPTTATVDVRFTTATVAARDAYGNIAAGWSSVTQCVAFSGPANAPDGATPTYPAQGTCAAGGSALSFDVAGTASGFGITLVDAQTTQLVVTSATKTGTSANIVVSSGPAAGVTFANASNRNGAVAVTCTGAITALTCTPSANNGRGVKRFFTAKVALVDAHQNLAMNATGGGVVVALAQTGGVSLSPVSLSIPNGQTTSTASFTVTLRNGNSATTVTASATVGSSTVTATLTTT